MPVAEINGHDLYYEDSGGKGAPIVFSHGFLMDHEMFAPQVKALAGEFRTVTWDERGFGASPATGPFSYWDLAADVVALLDHLDLEAAVLAGMSQGGFLSLRAALQAPNRVAGLVLIDTAAGTEDPATAEAYEALGRTFIDQGPEPVQDIIAAIILGQHVDPAPWFEKWATLDRKGFEYAFRCLMDRDDISDRVADIAAPAIIFHGSDDAAFTLDKAEFLRDHLPGCRDLVVVPGAGHASNLSHPDAVTPKLRGFLAAVG